MAPSHASRNSTLTDLELDQDTQLSPKNLKNKYSKPKTQKDEGGGEEDLDYAIDTSALHNALPDFSDGRRTDDEEADEDDISIEIGRGRKAEYRLDDSRDSILSLNDSRLTGSITDGAISIRKNTGAGSRTALRDVSNSNRSSIRRGDVLRKDAQIRRASLVAQKESMDLKPTKTRNLQQEQRQQRRTLSDMHAKVSEVYDGSYLSDERPPIAHMTTRNTRFGNPKLYDQDKITRAVRKASRGYIDEGVELSSKRQQKNNTESFLLPDVENLSELVSGIYQDGVPMNARQSRPRATRFTSPPAFEIPEQQTEQHVRLDAIHIPDDEKAIFNSLRMLQRKVSALEKDNADVEARLEELRQENTILRAEQLRRQKSGGDEDGIARGGAATLAVERNRLEAANLALQNQLEVAKRKLADRESSVQRVKEERNSVVNQLGSVYASFQELKADNEKLRQENDELKVQLAMLTGTPQNGKAERKTQDSSPRHSREPTRTKRNVADTCVSEPVEGVEVNRRRGDGKPPAHDALTLDQRARELINQVQDDNCDALFSLGLPTRRPSEANDQSNVKTQGNFNEKKQPNTAKQRAKKAVIDHHRNDDHSEFDVTMDTRDIQTRTITRDLTYLSFVDSREIARLRKTLEEERIARKLRRTHGISGQDKLRMRIEPFTCDLTTNSFRDTTRKSSRAPEATSHGKNVDTTGKIDDMTEDQGPISQVDDLTRASSRRGPQPTDDAAIRDMTSAFILPDITMHGTNVEAMSKGKEDAQLPASAQRALDQAVRHERSNCTVCKKDSSANDANDQPVNIPQPLPVSDRSVDNVSNNHESTTQIPKADSEEQDQTMRPSQPPSMALAKVLKILEDELAHLKMQLAVCQSQYARHDAAVGRRKRVKLGNQMKALMEEIENKSEVVYALYDVLEGQKEQKEKRCDDAGVARAPATETDKHAGGDREDSADEEDEDELPWEGFESTQDDITGRSGMCRKVPDL
ncbi:hypothetical protein VTO42DRAFT_1279 [Malbranchea cinnamomea]